MNTPQDNKIIRPKKVLLLSVSTGEGHNSAARAIAEVLRQRNIECEIVDSVEFKGKKSHSFIADGYSWIIRHTPILFGLAYVLGAAYDNMRLPSPIKSYHQSYAEKIFKYIQEGGFDCVICTHLFSMHTATAIRDKYMPDLPCYGVITDYTAIPFYRGSKLDAYFVPDDRTRCMLVKKGIPYDSVILSGIPVSPKYAAAVDRAQARELLGIPQDKKVVVISAGGAGCGKIRQLCKSLGRSIDDDTSVYVFVGKNKKLKSSIDKSLGDDKRFNALDFTPDINLYVKAADVAMTKPGGLSSTEFAISGTPLILLKAIPGCETCNQRYFVRRGMATYCKTNRKAIRHTLHILYKENAAEQRSANAGERAVNPNAAMDIVDFVMDK